MAAAGAWVLPNPDIDDNLAGGAALGAPVAADLLLRLEDPRLEAAYWRQPLTAGGARYDLACCLVGLGLQVLVLSLAFRGSPAAGAAANAQLPAFAAAHAFLASLPLLHAALIWRARPFYTRHRAGVQAALRLTRVAFHVWQTHSTGHSPEVWRAHALGAAAGPARVLAMSLVAVPLTSLVHTLLNPCPLAFHPASAAGLLYVSLRTWLPLSCAVWRHPAAAPATGRLCARLGAALLAADSSAVTAFGAPLLSPAAGAPAGGAGAEQRCAARLAVLALAIMITALAAPAWVAGRAELAGKRRFLQARGHSLRVRASPLERLAAWAGARGLQAPRTGPMASLPAVVAAPLVIWQLAELLARRVSPCGA